MKNNSCKTLFLMYHRIAEEECDPWALCVSPANFSEHLQVLKHVATPLMARQAADGAKDGNLPNRSVVITFDDGYGDNYRAAFPLLEKLDVPATFYVVSGAVGDSREFWSDELERMFLRPGVLPEKFELQIARSFISWRLEASGRYSATVFERHRSWKPFADPPTSRHALFLELWRRLRPLPLRERRLELDRLWQWSGLTPSSRATHLPMSETQLIQLSQSKVVEIGSHTVTHPQLSHLTQEDQKNEIITSRNQLHEITGQAIVSFAYPYGWDGDFNDDTISIVREAGFSSACTTLPGVFEAETDSFKLPRMHVPDMNGSAFEQQLLQWFG